MDQIQLEPGFYNRIMFLIKDKNKQNLFSIDSIPQIFYHKGERPYNNLNLYRSINLIYLAKISPDNFF